MYGRAEVEGEGAVMEELLLGMEDLVLRKEEVGMEVQVSGMKEAAIEMEQKESWMEVDAGSWREGVEVNEKMNQDHLLEEERAMELFHLGQTLGWVVWAQMKD